MKSREAKSILNKFRNGNYNNPDDPYFREIAHALDVILPKYDKLENRDTPMKTFSTNYHICPNCKNTYLTKYQNYCDNCGQRLDWSVNVDD